MMTRVDAWPADATLARILTWQGPRTVHDNPPISSEAIPVGDVRYPVAFGPVLEQIAQVFFWEFGLIGHLQSWSLPFGRLNEC